VGFPGVGYPWFYTFGLSCTTASNCVAVGEYSTTAGLDVTLALAENGETAQTTHPPAQVGQATGKAVAGR
jgi:hypothetical protein